MSESLRRSPVLQSGDLVRLISPASFPDQTHVTSYIQALQHWGLRCDTGDHVLCQHGYMAGTDDQRLEDLNNAFRDPEVRAIVTTRGGAGAYRIADDIDFGAVESDPKPILGFSDITSLQLSLFNHCNLGTMHGCLVGQRAIESTKQLLMSTDDLHIERNPDTVSASVNFGDQAGGRLIGGNLQALATSIGIRMPELSGALLFIEHHRLGLGTVDRYLTQLQRSGSLNGLNGVVLGSFEIFRDFTDRGWTIKDLLNDHFERWQVPVLGGIFAGHDLSDKHGNPDQYSLPLGAHAEIDVREGTLRVESIMR